MLHYAHQRADFTIRLNLTSYYYLQLTKYLSMLNYHQLIVCSLFLIWSAVAERRLAAGAFLLRRTREIPFGRPSGRPFPHVQDGISPNTIGRAA
jgi:hypothetical protein